MADPVRPDARIVTLEVFIAAQMGIPLRQKADALAALDGLAADLAEHERERDAKFDPYVMELSASAGREAKRRVHAEADLEAAREALRDEIAMADQAREELAQWQAHWKTLIDEDNPDGEPLIVEMLRSVIEDITPSVEARALAAGSVAPPDGDGT